MFARRWISVAVMGGTLAGAHARVHADDCGALICITAGIDTTDSPYYPPDLDWGSDPWSPQNPIPHPTLTESAGDAFARKALLVVGDVIAGAFAFPPSVPGSGNALNTVRALAEAHSPGATGGPVVTSGGQTAGADVAQTLGGPPTLGTQIPTSTGPNQNLGPRADPAPATEVDPVEPIRGEFVIEEIDLALPSASSVPFILRRTYRNRVSYTGPFGPAWDHNFNQYLVNLPAVSYSGAIPPDAVAYGRLGVALVPPTSAAEFPTETCGPSLALAAGNGTSMTFHERVVSTA